MKRRLAPGFTLIELVLALSIVAIMVTMLFGGLRVGVRAWQRGEERATILQHSRSMMQLLEEAFGGTFWYLDMIEQGPTTPVLLFKGEANRVYFVTGSPPIPMSPTIPFVAVTLSVDEGNTPGLAIREKALPAFDPFEAVAPLVVDPTVSAISFRYLRDAGAWEASWDSVEERALPRAIEVTLTATVNGRAEQTPPIVVPFRINAQ